MAGCTTNVKTKKTWISQIKRHNHITMLSQESHSETQRNPWLTLFSSDVNEKTLQNGDSQCLQATSCQCSPAPALRLVRPRALFGRTTCFQLVSEFGGKWRTVVKCGFQQSLSEPYRWTSQSLPPLQWRCNMTYSVWILS